MNILERIEDSLETIRPALQSDGGDVELVGFDSEEGIVRVRLIGMCGSCPISPTTVKYGIERRLKMTIPEVNAVQALTDQDPPDSLPPGAISHSG